MSRSPNAVIAHLPCRAQFFLIPSFPDCCALFAPSLPGTKEESVLLQKWGIRAETLPAATELLLPVLREPHLCNIMWSIDCPVKLAGRLIHCNQWDK